MLSLKKILEIEENYIGAKAERTIRLKGMLNIKSEYASACDKLNCITLDIKLKDQVINQLRDKIKQRP